MKLAYCYILHSPPPHNTPDRPAAAARAAVEHTTTSAGGGAAGRRRARAREWNRLSKTLKSGKSPAARQDTLRTARPPAGELSRSHRGRILS